MRSHMICVAVLLALTATASIAQPAMSTQSTCSKGPRMGAHQATAELIAARHAMKQACRADMATYCANVPKGCGAPKKCLKAHASQLSPACASAWQNMRALRHGT